MSEAISKVSETAKWNGEDWVSNAELQRPVRGPHESSYNACSGSGMLRCLYSAYSVGVATRDGGSMLLTPRGAAFLTSLRSTASVPCLSLPDPKDSYTIAGEK